MCTHVFHARLVSLMTVTVLSASLLHAAVLQVGTGGGITVPGAHAAGSG